MRATSGKRRASRRFDLFGATFSFPTTPPPLSLPFSLSAQPLISPSLSLLLVPFLSAVDVHEVLLVLSLFPIVHHRVSVLPLSTSLPPSPLISDPPTKSVSPETPVLTSTPSRSCRIDVITIIPTTLRYPVMACSAQSMTIESYPDEALSTSYAPTPSEETALVRDRRRRHSFHTARKLSCDYDADAVFLRVRMLVTPFSLTPLTRPRWNSSSPRWRDACTGSKNIAKPTWSKSIPVCAEDMPRWRR